ncbi:M20/M25/M40 family metallo-hydrolase [uncultured Dokdonia sp.]|uniref:M28 family metallopeptidase n=1 Tax=uncultured Dokdonia sp. TaxID=575653 RepID=UPI002624B1A8|nr:M20/M25/M40 family metallo-hydrolase [uncultured Dokdonia sp.]
MRKLFLLGVLSILMSCGSALQPVKTSNVPPPPPPPPSVKVPNTPKPDPTKDQMTMVFPNINKMTSVKKTIEFLAADELQGRDTGSMEIEIAAQFIEARFKNAGVAPYFETYRDNFIAKEKDAFNVVGVVEGNDPVLKNEIIIIGAHYDHIGKGKPVGEDTIANGANDNAAGTTAVLALADHFAKAKTNKRTIIFTLYSAEEKGLLGSKHLAKRLKDEKIMPYVMFNIEMIGVPMKDKDHLVYISGYDLSNMPAKFNEYAGENVIGFLPKAKEFNLFMRSDNYPFYQEFNIPAHTISSFDFTNYNHYHGVGDEADKMDIPFMEKVIQKLIPGLERMANTKTQEIKMNEIKN